METTFSVLFYLRSSRLDKNGEATVYLRITVDGERAELTTKRKIIPKQWNRHKGRAIGTSKKATELNRFLEELQYKVFGIQAKYTTKRKPFTAEMIKSKLGGKRTRTPKMLLELYQEHNKELAERVGKDYSANAYWRHLRTYKHLKGFIAKEFKKTDIPLKKIDLRFIQQFERYLRVEKLGGQNNRTKYVTNFKKIIRIAYAHDWISKNPFFHWKAQWKAVEREALTQRELQLLIHAKFKDERLERVRDVFVFSCFTGLAYVDVKKLSESHIVFGMNGERWIKTKRAKTQTASTIPLLPIAEQILAKYHIWSKQNNPSLCLPMMSNQKTNMNLKEIGKLCGIQKRLTFHLARHTFATTVTLANGVPIESVSKMLGHRSLATTQIYAKVVDRKLREDMQKVRGKFKDVI